MDQHAQLKDILESKAESFDLNKEKSTSDAKSQIDFLRDLINHVENSIFTKIEELFKNNVFADALAKIDITENSELDWDKLADVANAKVLQYLYL